MSILATVHIPDGIIMAADSRLTGSRQINNSQPGVPAILQEYTLSDCSQKVVLMHKSPIGISSCGDAMPNGLTVSDYLRQFEIDCMEHGDTVEKTANKLKKQLEGKTFSTNFVVAGYDDDIPYVYDVSKEEVSRINALNNGDISYGAHWNGRIDPVERLFNSQPCTVFPWHLMQLKDGADLAEFIVDTTIKYERFAEGIQTCGGPIDVLIITKDDAFWYMHKVFKHQ